VATMERKPFPTMSDDRDIEARTEPPTPDMFDGPLDPPPPLAPLRGGAEITALHDYWTRSSAPPESGQSPNVSRLVRKGRTIAQQAVGRADHDFLADLTRAVDAVAARCDELAAQLARHQILLESVSNILGAEVTHLRASLDSPPDSVGD
jgi:hypothetical protein